MHMHMLPGQSVNSCTFRLSVTDYTFNIKLILLRPCPESSVLFLQHVAKNRFLAVQIK